MAARKIGTITATFTRPSDTTAYTANDAMSNATGSTHAVMTFNYAHGAQGGSGRIIGATVVKSSATITNCDFDLVVWTTAPTAFEDNAAFDPSDSEILASPGFIEFLNGDAAVSTNNAFWCKTNLDLGYKLADASTVLYGTLVARAAYTPASAEVFTVLLMVEYDA